MIKLTHLKGLLRLFKPKNGLTVKRLLSLENLTKKVYQILDIPGLTMANNFKFKLFFFHLTFLQNELTTFKLATLSPKLV